jgi:hypothetical protein
MCHPVCTGDGPFASCLRRADVWLLFDDEKVKVSNASDVLSSEAYLLFYVSRDALSASNGQVHSP